MAFDNNIDSKILSIVIKYLKDSHFDIAVSLKTSIVNDLDLDSLTRMELMRRIEREFNIQLSVDELLKVNQIGDLIPLVEQARCVISKGTRRQSSLLGSEFVDPTNAKTLTWLLREYANSTPDRDHLYLRHDNGEEDTITYGELYLNALQIAHGLIEHGTKPNDTVAIMLPTCVDFFYAYMGILLAGAIPVPIYPPYRADKIEEYIMHEQAILNSAGIKILITFDQVVSISKLMKNFIPSLKLIAEVHDIKKDIDSGVTILRQGADAALIQFTSGSTGNPKGVVLSHENILANIRASCKVFHLDASRTCASWLPLYHDMGLIGGWLTSFYLGGKSVILSPQSFLLHPHNWLWAIHDHQAIISSSPNFGYEYCINKIRDREIAGLDLSAWHLALNGSEPVNPKTMDRFAERFSDYGFQKSAFVPIYGLAENSLALTYKKPGLNYQTDFIRHDDFAVKQRAVPVEKHDPTAIEIVSCGKVMPGFELRIVDENDNLMDDRKIGHLQFKGPSALKSYYHNPKAFDKINHDGWIDSGDLAYMVGEEVYITGRHKDLIIQAGRNYYPQDIEEIASCVPGIEKDLVIAFAVDDDNSGTESLIIIAETSETNPNKHSKLMAAVKSKVHATKSITVADVLLTPKGFIPKTSDGKILRNQCRKAYLSGDLEKKASATWVQIMHIMWAGFMAKVGRSFSGK